MFEMADILEGETGRVVLAIPEELPEHETLSVRLHDGGFDVAADGKCVGTIKDVAPYALGLLAKWEDLPVIECPKGKDFSLDVKFFAKVIDRRRTKV